MCFKGTAAEETAKETEEVMQWLREHKFDLLLNLRAGSDVVTYPYDSSPLNFVGESPADCPAEAQRSRKHNWLTLLLPTLQLISMLGAMGIVVFECCHCQNLQLPNKKTVIVLSIHYRSLLISIDRCRSLSIAVDRCRSLSMYLSCTLAHSFSHLLKLTHFLHKSLNHRSSFMTATSM